MTTSPTRWVLAFDGSCGSCGGIADAVAAACGDKIEVYPLQNPTISAWRSAALGEDAEWKPVLMKISGDDRVQAWTGTALASHLVARLGVGSSVGILRALGQLRTMNNRGEVRRPGDVEPLMAISRKRFLRNVGLGAATVVGILATGAAPASADTVKSWQRKNTGAMPTTYTEIAALPVAFRRVAFQEMTPQQKSAAWTAHLNGFSSKAAGFTGSQQVVFARAKALAKNVDTFRTPNTTALDALRADATSAFGELQAASLIGVLGQRDATTSSTQAVAAAAAVTCTCSTSSDYCANGRRCRLNSQNCSRTSGCGTFYSYQCNGLCA